MGRRTSSLAHGAQVEGGVLQIPKRAQPRVQATGLTLREFKGSGDSAPRLTPAVGAALLEAEVIP